MSDWIPTSLSLVPETGVKVLAFFRNEFGKKRIIMAAYYPPKTLPLEDDRDDDGGIYDEETDTYYCSEGWYETNEYEETYWKVSAKVTHWMPLPAGPEE